MSHDRRDEDPPEARSSDPNQGEGDRASARRYNDHVRAFVADGDGPARMTRIERLASIVRRARNALADLLVDLSDRVAVGRHARRTH